MQHAWVCGRCAGHSKQRDGCPHVAAAAMKLAAAARTGAEPGCCAALATTRRAAASRERLRMWRARAAVARKPIASAMTVSDSSASACHVSGPG